jgi:hypothetical protein
LFVAAGTIVQSVLFDHQAFFIESHRDLKRHYEDAQLSGASLRLKLINSDVAPISVLATGVEKDWTNVGSWLGKAHTGWPGGAAVRSSGQGRPKAASGQESSVARVLPSAKPNESVVPRPSKEHGNEKVARLLSKAPDTANDSTEDHWKVVTELEPSNHRHKRPNKPTFRTSGSQTAERKAVRFAEDLTEQRFFHKASKCCERLVNVSQMPLQTNHKIQRSLADAVHNDPCNEVIRILAEGGVDAEMGLNTQYEFVKESISKLKKDLDRDPSNSTLLQKMNDLQQKRYVLNIYVNCSHFITMAVRPIFVRNVCALSAFLIIVLFLQFDIGFIEVLEMFRVPPGSD